MLSSPMTSNVQLEKWCSKLRIPLNAIVSKDQLYRMTPIPGAYIINMDDSTGNGTHWIALWLTHPKIALYFDSFGIEPPNAVIDFCKRFGCHNIIASDSQIQNVNSGYCGQYCLTFLYQMTRKPNRISWENWYRNFIEYFIPLA